LHSRTSAHGNTERSLAPTDFITDILAKAEKHNLEVKLYLKKKMWLDPTFLSDDPSENRLEVFQLHSYILRYLRLGEFKVMHASSCT
jgi:hypothetical protein